MEHNNQIWCDRCGKYCGPRTHAGFHTCSPNPVVDKLRAENAELRKALSLAIRQNTHDMLMTADEIRLCENAIKGQT